MIGAVSIVIPTWGPKGVELTKNCLAALWASGLLRPEDAKLDGLSPVEARQKESEQAGLIVPEIVVVDDGSEPDDMRALEKVCADGGVAKLIHADKNTAHFAKNVNLGIVETSGNVVVAMNNDIEVLPGCIQTMLASAISIGLGLCAPKLLYPDMRIQFGGMVYIPNPSDPNAFGWFDHALRFQPRFHYLACGMRESLLTGACLMISRGFLDSVGMFDERFELTCEDVDLSLRGMAASIPVEYIGHAEAIHHEGKTRGNTLADKSKFPELNAKEQRSLALLFDKWPITHFHSFAPGGELNRNV